MQWTTTAILNANLAHPRQMTPAAVFQDFKNKVGESELGLTHISMENP